MSGIEGGLEEDGMDARFLVGNVGWERGDFGSGRLAESRREGENHGGKAVNTEKYATGKKVSEEEAREQAYSTGRAQRPIKQGMHAHAGSSEEVGRLPADFNEAGATLPMTTSVNPSISPDPATSRSVSPTTATRPASAHMVL